jgi:hypothetical protein
MEQRNKPVLYREYRMSGSATESPTVRRGQLVDQLDSGRTRVDDAAEPFARQDIHPDADGFDWHVALFCGYQSARNEAGLISKTP